MQEEAGEIDLRYFDASGFCLMPYIPYAWQEKGHPLTLEADAHQQFPLMTFGSYTTYVGGRLSEHFDHPFLSFEATCTIRTDTIPGGKQVHFAVQA